MLELRDVTKEEHDALFAALAAYFTGEDLGLDDEDRAYFLSAEYRGIIETLIAREVHPVRPVWLADGGAIVGFAMYCTYLLEDGKLFILEFNIDRGHRRKGFGARFYALIERREKARGARFAELTADEASGFWERQGFTYYGRNEDGQRLYRKTF